MERFVVPGLRLYGGYMVVLGLWQAVSPGTFFDVVGPFGVQNDHYTRDAATWSVALGVLCLLAVPRPSWRLPVLALAALQSGLHAVNHLIDVGEADPGWVGVFDAAALAVLTVLLVALVKKEPLQ